jgi:type IV pilus assembly protein PilO
MAMKLDDIKKLPPHIKALAICLVYILLGYLYYTYFLQADLAKKSTLQTNLQELEQTVAAKEKLASELGKYAKGVENLKESFKTALTKLPVRKEIPELLNSVALSGKDAGITFTLFEPQSSVKKPIGEKKTPDKKPPEQKPQDKKPGDAKAQKEKPPADEGDYYEEIPIKVSLNGGYTNTAVFFEKVAKLPRIINIEDISIGDVKNPKGKGLVLNTSCIIKTYMFVQKTGEKDKKTDEKKK